LTDSNQTTWTYREPECITFLEATVIKEIKNAVEKNEPLQLVPSTHNFPAVDSIVYDPNEDGLTCIQITINSEHPIAVSGLKRIQSGSTPVHRLQISALIEKCRGALYLLCRHIWRLHQFHIARVER
jgi:hypothetical protein